MKVFKSEYAYVFVAMDVVVCGFDVEVIKIVVNFYFVCDMLMYVYRIGCIGCVGVFDGRAYILFIARDFVKFA